MPDRPTLAVLTALRDELAPLRRRLGLRAAPAEAAGRWRSVRVMTAYTGMTGPTMLAAARRIEQRERPAAWLVLGFAGGLDPALPTGAVVRPAGVVDEHGGERVELWPGGDGTLVTAAAPVLTPQDKTRLHAQTGGAAVDMETHSIASWVAAQHGVPPVAALRAITDPADCAVPAEAVGWIGSDGRPRVRGVLASVMRRPGLIGVLPGLVGASRRAGAALAEAGEALLLEMAERVGR